MKKDNRFLSIVLPDLNGGGAQRMLLNMATEFSQRGYRVDVVTLCPSSTESYAHVQTTNLNFIAFNKSKALLALPSLIKYFLFKRPDFIISALSYVNILTLLAKKLSFIPKSKIFVTERAYHSSNAKLTIKNYEREKKLIRLLYPTANIVIGISKGVSQDIKEVGRLADDKVMTIYNPVITKDFKENADEVLDTPWLSTKTTTKKIIACGRLVPVKDYPTLIKAFAILVKDTDVKLGILGDGPLKNDLIQLAKEHNVDDKIEFLGFVKNTLPYIKNADVFALTSLSEGFGNVLVEALYCGIPIVSTDCPSGPREILDNGKYGHLVEIESPELFAAALKQALLEPINKASLTNRANDFNVVTICDEFENIFK